MHGLTDSSKQVDSSGRRSSEAHLRTGCGPVALEGPCQLCPRPCRRAQDVDVIGRACDATRFRPRQRSRPAGCVKGRVCPACGQSTHERHILPSTSPPKMMVRSSTTAMPYAWRASGASPRTSCSASSQPLFLAACTTGQRASRSTAAQRHASARLCGVIAASKPRRRPSVRRHE